MPLYDYVCTSCGHTVEVMHSVQGHGPSACPLCGSPMKKAFAPPAVHFKGSGWARKDRASSRPARQAERSGGSSGSDSSSDDAASSAPKKPKDGD